VGTQQKGGKKKKQEWSPHPKFLTNRGGGAELEKLTGNNRKESGHGWVSNSSIRKQQKKGKGGGKGGKKRRVGTNTTPSTGQIRGGTL